MSNVKCERILFESGRLDKRYTAFCKKDDKWCACGEGDTKKDAIKDAIKRLTIVIRKPELNFRVNRDEKWYTSFDGMEFVRANGFIINEFVDML